MAIFCIRTAEIYKGAVRHLGCIWFILLATTVTLGASIHLKTIGIAALTLLDCANALASLCLALLYLSFSRSIFYRSSPIVYTDRLLPSITAFAGTYLPWSFVLFASNQDFEGKNVLSVVFLLIGTVAAVVVTLYLGKSFSIVPQARHLVREGPYSFVRHPLYLAEEVALLGCLLRFFSPLTLAVFMAHCALQTARILI